MSDEKNEQKPDAEIRDLPTQKDVKGGGNPAKGGDPFDPAPKSGSGGGGPNPGIDPGGTGKKTN